MLCFHSLTGSQQSRPGQVLLRLIEGKEHVRGVCVTSRPQCSSFHVIVKGSSNNDVIEVGVGSKEVEQRREGERRREKVGERSSNNDVIEVGVGSKEVEQRREGERRRREGRRTLIKHG